MKHALLLAVGILGLTVLSAGATESWMNDNDISKAFSSVTIDGAYADGMSFTETYTDAGTISYRDPRKAMTGRWSVINSAFCTLYDGVITGGCFKVIRHSQNCYEFYFVAGSEAEAARPDRGRPSWTARGWNKALPPTCDEKPVV
jgi:hypothetical protein